MLRTIISLDANEKAWLDQEAAIENVSMAEVVRKAIRFYRLSLKAQKSTHMDDILKKTAGIWKKEDGLTYQEKIREDWEK